MISVQRGPVTLIPDSHRPKFDISFRMVTSYITGTDSEVTRLDVLLRDPLEQLNVSFTSGIPGEFDLKVPRSGVSGGMAVKCSRRDLIEALRGLADALDKNWEQSADGTETVRERR